MLVKININVLNVKDIVYSLGQPLLYHVRYNYLPVAAGDIGTSIIKHGYNPTKSTVSL